MFRFNSLHRLPH